MSEWITDRLPTPYDCRYAKKTLHHEHVWVMYNGEVEWCFIQDVAEGCPWHPIVIEKPEPFVAPEPKYSAVLYYACNSYRWAVSDGSKHVADNLPTQEAAERFAALYNEVMP